MKRKVFSLLMLCLFAFLGMANAQPKGDGITVTPDPIDLGYRPIGAWMRPLDVQFVNEGVAKTIINIEADKTFFVIDAQLPGTITNARPYEFTITHGEAEPGVIQGNLVAMTENRKAYVFDIMAVAYNPIEADVVETAPVIELPFTATVGENIYNNYLLPGDKADGKDVVYKMNIENDILFSANVQGANGKVALYNEDFNGEPGPGATNNFGGQSTGGGEPFEAQIGSVTGSSNGYFPFYTLYNYSIAENLFLASELEEAGVTTAPMGSLSWYATNSTGAEQKNLSIWMANVSEDVLTNSSYITSDMTLVYSGNMTPQVGWNEFVFNQDNFAWDGSSNVLICVQRNNGSWNNTIYWATHAPGFAGQAYKYTDSAPYDMETTSYPITPTSNNRASIVFKSVGRTDEPEENIEDGMTLTPGVYYLVASSTSDEFTVNVNSEILPAPEPPYNPSPFDGETGITSPAVLTWTFGEYTTGYRVLLGTTYPPVDVVVDWTNNLNNTLVVPNLYNNKTYLWQVEERNSNGVTSGPIWGFTTALNVPQNVTAENPKIYEGDVLHMSWTAINDRSYRGYNVYQDGVKINEGLLTTTEFSVAGLTYNTTTGYNFNVTAVYDEGESNFSNDLNVLVSGDGSISGKVLEIDGATGIANATVNFDGVDEFNRPVSYTFTTGSNGTYTGVMRAGNYTAMVSKEGYQAVESDGTIHIDYDENTSNVNFMLQEILYPVGEVIAEEMSDTQVKVYWSQNIMSEIIEDFETGDFNSFDWQNNSSYPWAITTTQPYEGTYCMKSTNEAIASSTSSIEVSVEINRDGLMSFYHRISSEGTYDKGYFYIDGVEKKYVSGNAPWAQLEYPITAGVHTFKWAYTKDSSVNSNEDCWYVDNISFIHDAEPMPAGTIFDFEDNSFMGWISLDADGDGYGWELGADVLSSGGYGHNGSDGMVLSRSYVNSYGPLTPDNYLISPQVTLGGSISFYACAQDASYAAEHFGVAVSTTGMNASDFTTIQEWTMSAKGEPYPGPRGTRAQGNWYLYTVDLSAYSGQGYVALRHFNCTDMFYLDVDDIIISDEPAKNRAFDHYNVYRAFDGDEANAELITSVTDTVFFDNEWADLEPGVYKWGVSRVYEGNRGNREVILSEGFEGSLSGWVVIDADGDGQNWGVYGSSSSPAGHNSNVTATSASYSGGVLYPDNYLVTPEVTLGGSVNFWACAQDASWPSEHFGVAISTTTNDDPSAFTTIQEWTMSAKSIGQPTDETRSGNRAQGAWYEFTVDLSSYSGQGYIAFRHFNCSDWFRLNVDDVVVTAGGNPEPPVPPITGGNESDIVWSNIIEHNMFVGASVTVNTNSGDDVTGTTVTLTNTSEPGLNYNYNVTLDETGIYTWESIRRGTYDVSVNLEGFEPITESVEISDNTQLNYTLHEIITAVSDLYVSGTGWAIFGNIPTPDNPDGPTPPSDGWTEGFENGGIPANWTVLDSNNDSYTWTATSAIPTTWTYYASLSLDWYHTGTDAVCSGSYINGVGALSPDEYLITPQVTPSNGSTFSFWAAAADASYPADHFSVAVSTTTPTASEFTMLQEWTLTAKEGGMNGGRASREGKGAKLGSWHSYSVDLSSYAGQSIYIAIHHFGCYDQYIMCVDDIEFTTARSVEYYNVKLDGVLEGTTTNPFFQHDVEGFVEGETHTTSVQKVYTTGESEWVSFDWVYTPCDNFGGLQAEPTAQWQGENVVLNWVLPEGGDTPTPPDPQPTTVYDFEDGTMQGWTSLDADGDGFGWDMMSNFGPGYGHNASQDGVFSQSYNNNYGALNPDNYLVSPQVELGGEISFYACAQDASWAAEHFGVAVSTTTATAAAFTTIQEWTMSAKGVGAPTNVTRDGSRAQGNWYLYTVDLSNYAGQTGYVAIRHFACTDMFYLDVDDITLGGGGGDTPTPPDPPAGNTYDFEDGTLQGWTTIDADGDGFDWAVNTSFGGHNGSLGIVYSQSYDNNYGALNPDNYLVSPQVTLGGQISFYACGQDASWANEHFGVAVSTTTATAAAFTTIQEWTMSAKGVGAPTNVTRDGSRAQGNWYLYTVDLSSYAGQTGYVAIRHFDCTDMFYLDVDDITLGDGNKGNRDVLFTDDFEDGALTNWTTIDADGDGDTWQNATPASYGIGNAHSGSNCASSWSWNSYTMYPDNYMISPLVEGAGSIHYYVATNTGYPDHYGIFVSTSGTNASDFTHVFDETVGSKGVTGGVRSSMTQPGTRAMSDWIEKTIELPAGTKYVAFRHYNSDDMNYLFVDDVTIYSGNGGGGDDPTPPDPQPNASVRGVEIFRNGEWIAEVSAPAQTYTDIAPEDAEYYEIRVVYNGNVEDYTHYTMSCPEMCVMLEDPCAVTPNNLTGNYEWVNGEEFGALINWTYGEANVWLYYDNGTMASSIGEGSDHLPMYWGIMIPAADLTLYNGCALTQVAFFEYQTAGTYTVNIYVGGNNAPGTLVHTQDVAVEGNLAWNYVELTSALAVDPTQNLWIILYEEGNIEYPATCSANTGDPNGRWISEDGTNWFDVASFGLNYTWMVRGFVTSSVEPDALVALEPFNGGSGHGTLSAVECAPITTEFNFSNGMREPVSFNVYRDGSVIGNVDYTGAWIYNYFDNVAIGNYQYQVTAVYDDCESDFALTPDLSQNYVEINVTSVTEYNETRIYPNPTTGIVTIEANGMNHITVVNTLGQVLYDANVNGDACQLNLGQYQAGVYMVRIATENGVSVKRVTVAK